MKSVEECKHIIREALESQGDYTSSMETAILLAAGNLRAYYLALQDLDRLEDTFIVIKSREGNERYETHPVFSILKDTAESLRKSLRELNLTLQTLTGATDNDPMDTLVNKVGNVG